MQHEAWITEIQYRASLEQENIIYLELCEV